MFDDHLHSPTLPLRRLPFVTLLPRMTPFSKVAPPASSSGDRGLRALATFGDKEDVRDRRRRDKEAQEAAGARKHGLGTTGSEERDARAAAEGAVTAREAANAGTAAAEEEEGSRRGEGRRGGGREDGRWEERATFSSPLPRTPCLAPSPSFSALPCPLPHPSSCSPWLLFPPRPHLFSPPPSSSPPHSLFPSRWRALRLGPDLLATKLPSFLKDRAGLRQQLLAKEEHARLRSEGRLYATEVGKERVGAEGKHVHK